jgi:glycosyltransferase involved in cell wall biosynthesis
MNKGIEKATGEVVGILNSDDLYSDQHVLSEIAGIFQDPEIDGAYADLEYVAADDLRHVKRNWVSGYYKPGSFVKGWMPPHPTFFVRRKLYTALGNYNTDFRISADYELMLRFIHKHEIKLAYLPRSIIKMRVGGKSNATLKNRIQANKEDRKAWRINGLKPAVFTHFRKPLSKLVQFFPQSK